MVREMTGLETILSTILEDAKASAQHVLDEARQEAQKLEEQARLEAESRKGYILEAGRSKAQALVGRAESAAQLSRRRALLVTKQRLIGDVVADAKAALENLPPADYFEVLLKLAAKFAAPGEGVMKLSGKDLQRLPESFGQELQKRTGQGIRISPDPAPIPNGFLLVYGGIDINCTFDALFEDSADLLQDKANSILFA